MYIVETIIICKGDFVRLYYILKSIKKLVKYINQLYLTWIIKYKKFFNE